MTSKINLFNTSHESNIHLILFLLGPHWIKVPLLSLVYLENFLSRKGFNVKIINLNTVFYNLLKLSNKEWLTLNGKLKDNIFHTVKAKFPALIDELIREITNSKAKILGFSLFSRNRKATMDLVNEIHSGANSKLFVFGGPEVLFEYYRDTFFDELKSDNSYFILGEGESPLLNICEYAYSSKYLNPRLYKGKKLIMYNEIGNLDSLPFLNFDNLNLDSYNSKILPLFSSRGCIRRCRFCSECKLYKSFRQHSPEYIIELIKYLINKYKISTFSFHDSLINANLVWLDKFCSIIIKQGIRIKWEAQLIIRDDMPKELLDKMKLSGCFNLFVGLESASNKILKLMQKGHDNSKAKNFFKLLSEARLQFEISLIVGFPQENESDFTETLRFIKENKKYIPKIAQVNPFIEYPPSQINKQKPSLYKTSKIRINRLLEMFKKEKIKYTSSFINNLIQNED